MRKILNSKSLIVVCLITLVYCLSVLIKKRINPNSGFDFRLWSPYYLIIAIILPIVFLLPIRLLPTSSYSKFVLQKEIIIKKVIVISTGILLIWLSLWYTMIGIGKSMDSSLKTSEAESAALVSIKNDSIISNKIGLVDKIESISTSISSKTANFEYILHGKDSTLTVVISLSHDQKWIVDAIRLK